MFIVSNLDVMIEESTLTCRLYGLMVTGGASSEVVVAGAPTGGAISPERVNKWLESGNGMWLDNNQK